MSMFEKATKTQLKARVALDGPAGSGKTFTALSWARVLGDKIALVDTERRSARYYADLFDFDTADIVAPYDPAKLVAAFQAAEKARYDVMVVDSLSHFWDGEGGVIDIADAAGKRAGDNSWAGWKTATPQLRHLVDVMLGSEMHVIVTMRSKTEWATEEYTDRDGRKKNRPVRIGLAPVMRAGMEYEFTVVGDLNLDHQMSISKTRCHLLADLLIQPGRFEPAEQFKTWLDSGEPELVDVRTAKSRLMDAVREAGWQYVEKDKTCPAAAMANHIWNGLGDEPVTTQVLAGLIAQVPEPPPDDDPDAAPFVDEPAAGTAVADDAQLADASSSPVGEGPPAETVNQGHQEGDPPATRKRGARSPGEALHRLLGGMKFSAEDQKDLIFAESNGRTIHASELTDTERELVITRANAISDGRYSMVQLQDLVRAKRDEQLADQLEQSLAGKAAS